MVGRYRSRRKRKSLPKLAGSASVGGSMLDEVAEQASKAVNKAKKNVKMAVGFDHDASDVQKMIEKYPEAHHHLKRVARGLKTHAYEHYHNFPTFATKHPDRSVDIGAFAKQLAKQHVFKHMPKKGGSLEKINKVVHTVRQFADPLEELRGAKDAYDGVNFHPRNASQAARSVLSAYQGNFAMGAAHMKTGAIAAPLFAPELGAAAQGFHYASEGLGKLKKIF